MERLRGLGLSEVKTPFGHTVPVYDIERTLCDILRSRSSVEIQVFRCLEILCSSER